MTLPTPYYQDEQATIYCADCRDVLPHLGRFDLLLTDPPYGIGYDASHSKYKNGIDRGIADWDARPFDPSHLIASDMNAIIWGGNCFASRLPDFSGWLAWVKTARNDADIRQADMELAWTNCISRSKTFRHLWIGAYRQSESGIANVHPTQKPVQLMSWCLGLLEGINSVLDPYMGSGTTLVAAKLRGIKAVGIELEEKYCAIAVERLRQGVLITA